ncbi:uncharacterized protein LOC143236927 [Tachypleus tridentatus]|uniref:uncharacterized protein LOC143236927 n=1 Tax=Tachypleus tridentatus TaxID=6853 RepID=UPI003FD4562A
MNLCESKHLAVYAPQRELSIDESIIKFKGRVHLGQYLLSKPTRWGIKQFALCENKSGYALKFITYCGKNTIVPVAGYSVIETLGGYRNTRKPLIAETYNQHVGGVDIMDQNLGTFMYPHKSAKWYFTIYHRLREEQQ